MKKVLFALLALTMLFALAACGKTGICDGCGKEGKLEKVTISAEVDGEEKTESFYACEDCIEEMNSL